MKSIFKSVAASAIVLCASCLPLTHAVAVPLTSTEVIFDFDFTAFSPAPPFANITFGATFSGADPVSVNIDTVVTRIYGGLAGTQLIQVRNDSAPGFSYNATYNQGGTVYGPLTTANPIFDPMRDGVFSIGLQATAGSAELMSIFSCGNHDGGPGPCITLAVPEPSAAMLFPMGLLALGALSAFRLKQPAAADRASRRSSGTPVRA